MPEKPQYTCEKHGDISCAVITTVAFDRDTGDIVDEFVGCGKCYVEFMRANICVAIPVVEEG